MRIKMATRTPSKGSLTDGTEFQLHKSQLMLFSGIMSKVIDFTEHKLLKCIDSVDDVQQKVVLKDLLDKYRKGTVAVSWRKGRPVQLPVTKEKLLLNTASDCSKMKVP